MNGQTKSLKKYNAYIKNMPEPIMPSQLQIPPERHALSDSDGMSLPLHSA